MSKAKQLTTESEEDLIYKRTLNRELIEIANKIDKLRKTLEPLNTCGLYELKINLIKLQDKLSKYETENKPLTEQYIIVNDIILCENEIEKESEKEKNWNLYYKLEARRDTLQVLLT